jgi:curved DNA-binding protein CbpA
MDYDPYKVFGLKKHETSLEMLKSKFRKVAIKVHPDKGGSDEMFNFVVECYKDIYNDLKMKDNDKLNDVLKNEFKKYKNSQNRHQNQNQIQESNSFTIDRFNQLFNESRIDNEEYDNGYGNMMEPSDNGLRPDISLPKIKNLGEGNHFKNNEFNKHFNSIKTPTSKTLTKYQEPEALCLSKNIRCSDIVSMKIDDYSGENNGSSKIHYTDYKIAHNTSRLADPYDLERHEKIPPQNLDSFKAIRKHNTFEKMQQLTNEEEQFNIKKQILNEKNEIQRQAALRKMDQQITDHYNKLSGRLMPQQTH